MLGNEWTALRGKGVEVSLVEILRGRPSKFGLAPVVRLGLLTRLDEIRDRVVRLESSEGVVKGRARHAERLGLRPKGH